jgi:fibronectin-binding autotransporter adhesin
MSIAQAATITWDSEGGDSLWETAANWGGDALPGAGDLAKIEVAADVTLSTPQTIDRFNMTKGGISSSLTIASGGILSLKETEGGSTNRFRQFWNTGTGASTSTVNVAGGILNAYDGIDISNNAASDQQAFFNVTDGGTVNITTGDFDYSSANGAVNAVLVDGAGSTISVGNAVSDTKGTTTISSGSSLTVSNGGTFTTRTGTIAGVLAGAGGTFVQDGLMADGTARETILSGVNTFTGTYTVNNGTLQIGGSGTLGSSTAAVSIASGATFEYSTTADGTIDGVVSGAGGVTLDASATGGILTLSSADSNVTYTGGTVINSGTLRLVSAGDGTAQDSNTTDWALSSSTTINSGGKFVLDTSSMTDNRTRVDAGAITVNSGGVFEVAHNSTNLGTDKYIWTGGSVSGDGTILKTGEAYADIAWGNRSGTSLNAFDGLLDVDEGELAVNGGNVATYGSGSADLDIATGAAFDVRSGTFVMDALDGTGTVNNSSGTGSVMSLGNNNGSGSFSGNILAGDVDGFSLIKNGTGTQTLSGTNTYAGSTTINAGVLVAASSAALGSGGDITFGGGQLQYGSGITEDYSDRIASSGSAISVDTNGNDVTWDTALASTNTGGLSKAGSGTLTLSVANTYTGTTAINAGVLVAANSAALGSGGNITFGGGQLQYGSGITEDYSDRIASSGSAISVDTNGNDVTWGTALASSNTGGLSKAGSGILTLSGNNSYTGTTTVNAGTLVINGNQSSANGVVTVASGGTLGGSGTIGGATTIQGGGALAPGNSPGLLTFSGDLTLDSGSSTVMEITGTTRGSEYDAIDVDGSLTYGGALTITSDTTIASGTYDLFSFGSETADFSSVVLSGSAYANDALSLSSDVWSATVGAQTFSFSQLSGDLTVVPEPQAYALLIGLLSLSCVITRRRR